MHAKVLRAIIERIVLASSALALAEGCSGQQAMGASNETLTISHNDGKSGPPTVRPAPPTAVASAALPALALLLTLRSFY